MILVMARWTDDDLSGTVVEKAIKEGTGDPWKIIRISALAECPIHECPPLEAEEGESFTDEELEAHAKVNGRWRAQTFGELVADCMGPRMAAALRDNDREAGIVRKWWATTEDGTLCARPTAGGGA
jgi:hypothetical protein